MSSSLRDTGEGLVWLIGAVVCLCAKPRVQLFVRAGNGCPRNALKYHWLMPISCYFQHCKSASGHESDLRKQRYSKYLTFAFNLPRAYFVGLRKSWLRWMSDYCHLVCTKSSSSPCVIRYVTGTPWNRSLQHVSVPILTRFKNRISMNTVLENLGPTVLLYRTVLFTVLRHRGLLDYLLDFSSSLTFCLVCVR